jgi:hypothetical protein
MAYYNMLAWWQQRTERERDAWWDVVHADGLITQTMAGSLGSFAPGAGQRKAWLIPIYDSTSGIPPAPTWIMSRPFEAFLRTQCTPSSLTQPSG